MIKTNINIYILSFNKSTMEYEILSTKQDRFSPPKQEIAPNIDIQKNLLDLVSKYISVNDDVFGYIFLDINISNEIDIIYYITIPYNYPKNNSYFVSINKTSDDNHIKNIRKIINRI